MTAVVHHGLFVAEGTSDAPLADVVVSLFLDRDVVVNLSRPDFSLLPRVEKDVRSRLQVGGSSWVDRST